MRSFEASDPQHPAPVPTAPAVRRSLGDTLARVLILPLLLALLGVLFVFHFAFTASLIDGESMAPTLRDGDRTLMTKGYTVPIRGDVVVANIGTGAEEDRILKRIVAVAGDTVEVRDDVAFVNGEAESVAQRVIKTGGGENRAPLVVPEGHVYLMGDNRVVSLDSRFLGPIELDRIYGKVVYVFWPPSSAGKIQ